MPPKFRADLKCIREEQQGVVFYRIDDPNSQTSFRLYEIEYLIAQKLDGTRDLLAVIAAVKSEFNFDISEADLQKFVSQLESMGFAATPGAASNSPEAQGDEETHVMRQRQSSLEFAEPDLLMDEPSEPDEAELHRLLKSAFLHVKQGYIVHARDYFLAAKELNPRDERLATIVGHLEIIGDASGPAEVEYLWNQACQLFPEMADEIEPFGDGPTGMSSNGGYNMDSDMPNEDLGSRLRWSIAGLAVIALGIAGLIWWAQVTGFSFGSVRVKVYELKAERIAVYYEDPAIAVTPSREAKLVFGKNGKVEKGAAAKGKSVKAGDILANIKLPKKIGKQLKKSRGAVKKAQNSYDKAAAVLNKLGAERDAIVVERDQAEDRLKELQSQSALKKGGASRRDIERWRKVKADANKKLSKLAKKERKPRGQVSKAKAKLEASLKKLAAIEKQNSDLIIKAPFDGVVVKANVEVGKKISKGATAYIVRDVSNIRLKFKVPGEPGVQSGGECYVAVGRGEPTLAKVAKVSGVKGKNIIAVDFVDSTGGFIELPPTQFSLVKAYVEPAYRIAASALAQGVEGDVIFVAFQDQALARTVEILQQDAATAIVRDLSGVLRAGDRVVVASIDAGDVKAISDGTALEIESE